MIKLGTNSIGGVYLGTNKIGKAYLGSNLVFQKGSSPTPSTMIPYIRGGADGSYIDTGITPDNTTRVIVWARNWNPATSNNMLFGYMDSGSNSNGFSLATWATASTGRIGVYFGDYTNPYTIVEDAFQYLGGYHKYELDGKVFKIDDNTVATSGSTATISTSGTIHLFGRNTGGTHSNTASPIDICACQIYKNNVLVRDYTPVNSPSLGLYDAVSDTVFTNAGSGSFTYGTFNPDAYTPLEYITTSGSSCFITPAIGTYSLPIVIKFKPTGTSKSWYSPLGGRNNTGDTKRCEVYTGNTSYSNCRLYAILGSSDQQLYTSSTAGATRKELIVVKNNNAFSAYYNHAAFGSTVTFSADASYNTNAPIGIGATWQAHDSSYVSYFVGDIYYVGLGGYNLVPAKKNNVAGMYDTYNDVFYQSESSTPFTAGPEL